MKKTFELINRNLFFSKMARLESKRPNIIVPVITISREFGSGGGHIGILVAKVLKKPWKVYHKELVEEIAKESHLEKRLIREVDEGRVPLIEEFIDSVLGRRHISLSNYYRHLLRVLSTIGQRGYAVIVGRGANFLFPNALKIRIIAPMDYRIKTIMKHRNLSEKQAVAKIEYVRKQRLGFVEELFRKDIRKSAHYDLTIQMSDNLDPKTATEIIVCAAKKRFFNKVS